MSGPDDDQEKPHEASQKRLDDARRKGEIPRSQDLATAAGYGGLFVVILGLGGVILRTSGEIGMVLLGQADQIAPQLMAGARAPMGGLMGQIGLSLAPLFLLPAAAVLAVLAVQRALVFAPTKLNPKLDRISPLAGFRNRFGRNGLFEFAKSFLKLVAVSLLFAISMMRHGPEVLDMLHMEPALAAVLMFRMMMEFLLLVVLFSAAVGGLDYLWQRAEHLRRHRMSRQELVDESKDSEGDPHVKAQRRRRAMDVATNRMLQDVAKSDVIVVNPTHYAVALKWKRGDRRAPVCVAKGVDEIAARIRERAIEAGVPIHCDPPTARAIHATVKIGDEIRSEQYRAVAAAIRFSEAMRRKVRAK